MTFVNAPKRLLISVSLASLAISTSAVAADADGLADDVAGDTAAADDTAAYDDAGGEAIIVTARRREEGVQDVPIALSVVSAAALGALCIEHERRVLKFRFGG